MAHVIPCDPVFEGGGSRAERDLFEALRGALDDGHFIYHRFAYIEETRAREGEADFIVLHPDRGLLVIECKGAGVRRTGTGQWVRLEGAREVRLRKSPFAQAQGHVKDLVAELARGIRRAFPHIRAFPLVHGHAVAFPRAVLQELALPLDVKRETVLDAHDLDRIGARIDACFAFWRRAHPEGRTRLRSGEFRKVRKHILHPLLRIVPCFAGQIASERRALVRLSREQTDALHQWLASRQLRVSGGAGTGKTLLALEAAHVLAREGERVLLLCFNKALGHHLKATVAAWPDDARERVYATHFHSLCFRASHLVDGRAPEVPRDPEAGIRFWETDAPLLVLRALEAGKLVPFDALVVDEGQDFAASWWDVLFDLVKDGRDGRVLVFYDPSQEIFGRPASVPPFPAVLTLGRNFRNTRAIADVVRRLGHLSTRPFARCPEGTPPTVLPWEAPAKTLRRLDELVDRLLRRDHLEPRQITLLTPHAREHSSLAGIDTLAGEAISHDPLRRQHALLHATISGFKGLESDVVVLLDIDPDDPRCSRNARYVAASRARHALFVFARGDWMAGAAP